MLYNSVPIIVICLLILIYIEEYCRDYIIRGLCKYRITKSPSLHTDHYYVTLSLLFAVMGYILQDPNRLGLVCDPRVLPWYYQTHGYWHICMAISISILWKMFWNEFVIYK